MTQTTSGIEPVFLPVYKRRKKVNPNDKNVTINYKDDVGDAWEEYYVFHHKFLTWCIVNGHKKEEVMSLNPEQIDDLVRQSPYYKATSNDIDWLAKVRLRCRAKCKNGWTIR